MVTNRILVVDDESLMREYVEEALLRAGHDVSTASSGRQGVELLANNTFDILITDLKMTPMDGLEVVRQARELSPDTHCMVMTAYGTIETAISAMKCGAEDYILKPFTPEALELAIEKIIAKEKLSQENRYLRAELNQAYDFGSMIGESGAMKQVYEQIEKVASSRANVMVRGETGTGKELVARAVHFAGNRRDMPFVKVNCAALSAGLLESELFGHEKGSFTGAHERKIGRFEIADGGTLLLDEISEMNLDLQPKLLRALQEREIERVGGNHSITVDTRIVATSNRKLEEAVEEGLFREDLYFRLHVIPITLPPLRERREDIKPLMEHFLHKYIKENALKSRQYAAETIRLFTEYDWPGNVRELQNAVERGVIFSSGPTLTPDDFALGAMSRKSQDSDSGVGLDVGCTVAEMEKKLILKTLEAQNYNRTKAASVLGISVRTLRNKLNEYSSTESLEEE